jgi:hypothetical protein
MSDKMNTYSGMQFNPMEIEEKDVCIEDIAHALSLLCRGGGHLKYFYSVGQHSINCANEALARRWSKKVILGCLLHDASEAYISDIIRPVKKHLINYLEIEEMIMNVIFQKFGLSNFTEQEKKQIKQIDDEMLEHELHVLLNNNKPKPIHLIISEPNFQLESAENIEQRFINLFYQIER